MKSFNLIRGRVCVEAGLPMVGSACPARALFDVTSDEIKKGLANSNSARKVDTPRVWSDDSTPKVAVRKSFSLNAMYAIPPKNSIARQPAGLILVLVFSTPVDHVQAHQTR